ncbi:hypothetical protein [Streptomyces decoyicus]|uniref:hypothetical protein n=1 Tax=Streptomyces decoyicus TaxID=249567 RepID=UPI003661EBB5
MSQAVPIATYEWQWIAEEFLDYLGALSVDRSDLDAPEAKAVLWDAAEAAAGAVAYAAYHPYASFHVMLDYVNFGMSYDPGGEKDPGAKSARRSGSMRSVSRSSPTGRLRTAKPFRCRPAPPPSGVDRPVRRT